jgi:hypothetical protein
LCERIERQTRKYKRSHDDIPKLLTPEVQERLGVFSAIYSWLSALLTANPGLFIARLLQSV